jgi:hypothetical protein
MVSVNSVPLTPILLSVHINTVLDSVSTQGQTNFAYLILSNAFGTVPHSSVIGKLGNFGVSLFIFIVFAAN